MAVLESIKRLLATRSPDSFVQWALTVFLLPVGLFLVVVGELLFGDANAFDVTGPWALALVPLMLGFSAIFWWILWWVLIPRTLKLVGLWDPFWRSGSVGRRWVLRGWVRLAEWWAERRFGEDPSSEWASFIGVLSERFLRGDIFLGRLRLSWRGLSLGGLLRPIGIPTDKHMVTIGSTGSGKSSAALVPNLCIHPGALLCIDPKGELAQITATRRGGGGNGVRGMGQKVCVLDPFGTTGFQSAAYNVFDEMAHIASSDADRVVSYASKVAKALVKPTSAKETYWDDAAQTFLRALILYIFSFYPPEKWNLLQVTELANAGDVDSYNERRAAGKIRRGETAFDVLIESMRQARGQGPYGDAIAREAAKIDAMAEGQWGGVITSAAGHLDFLAAKELQRVCMRSDFLLEDFKTQNLSVYVCLPINALNGIESRWLRMFVVLFTDMMTRKQEPPRWPVLFAIDEFPTLGWLEGIEAVAPTFRSYGVRFWVIGQDVAQFKAVYPETWTGLIGNAEAVQFIGVKHKETLAYLVELLGMHVVRRKREFLGERPLLNPDHAARLLKPGKGNQIIWRGSDPPMLLKTAPYYRYLPAWYYDPGGRRDKWNRWIWRWGRRSSIPRARSGASPPASAPPPNDSPAAASRDSFSPFPPPPGQGPVQPVVARTAPVKSPFPPLPSPTTVPSEEEGQIRWSDFLKECREDGNSDHAAREAAKAPAVPKAAATGPGNGGGALVELEAMVGLEPVKQQVRKTVNLVKLGRARDEKGLPRLTITHHLVFTGNPGTGKTTVARIVGRIYKEIGLLKSGHMIEVDRGGLVAGYLGHTAKKVEAVVDRAMDGVLFIDEAYSLVPAKDARNEDIYGAEAIATLLKFMEDRRDRLVVIVAGYRDEMKRFIASNPGLESRFKTFIDFPDYEPGELYSVFEALAGKAGCKPSLKAKFRLYGLFGQLERGKGFGNGRVVRNIFEECVARQANRLAARGRYLKKELTTLEEEDIPAQEDLKRLSKEPEAKRQGSG
jgi:stage V sporulation protein K